MHVLVTGGAGFIGSHLCDALVERGCDVWCVDNLWLGLRRNIAHLEARPNFRFLEFDLLDRAKTKALFAEARFDEVFHLAANSDIRGGARDVDLDWRLNFMTTLEVLSAMHASSTERLFFASTSAVFGETTHRLHEDYGPLKPISLYGASKLAAEAYISVFVYTMGIRAVVLRFPNVVGERATHGAVYDFLRKLEADPSRLEVLGDGKQTKPYLYVGDLVVAILAAWDGADEPYAVFHAGSEDETSVRKVAEIVVAAAGRRDTRIEYTGGNRGWPGDVPRFRYDTGKLRALGWRPRYGSAEAVQVAVERIIENGF